MNARKILIITLVLCLVFGTVVYADTSNRLRIWVNKAEIEDSGVLVDGKAYLSVRSVADKLQAMLSWDDATKSVTIHKPNVHMVTLGPNGSLFGDVSGGKMKFKIFAQIDNLKVDINAFKVTITNPYNEETLVDSRKEGDDNFPKRGDEDFWVTVNDINYDFSSKGKYVVSFWMKAAGETNYQIVSEKIIKSTSK